MFWWLSDVKFFNPTFVYLTLFHNRLTDEPGRVDRRISQICEYVKYYLAQLTKGADKSSISSHTGCTWKTPQRKHGHYVSSTCPRFENGNCLSYKIYILLNLHSQNTVTDLVALITMMISFVVSFVCLVGWSCLLTREENNEDLNELKL